MRFRMIQMDQDTEPKFYIANMRANGGCASFERSVSAYETARIRHPTRRCGGCVAAGGAEQQGERMRRIGFLMAGAENVDQGQIA